MECRFKADTLTGRTGLFTKTESSGYGIFISDGRPSFSINLDGKYLVATASSPLLKTDQWHSLAGVYDGREARLYLDGKLIDSVQGQGKLKDNRLPMMIGSDVGPQGKPNSFFNGLIDHARLTPKALYSGEQMVAPQNRQDAVIDLRFNENIGPWHPDGSASKAHAMSTGDVNIERVEDK